MRHVVTSLLVAGCVSSTAVAFQARGGATATSKACALLTHDLLMKVSTSGGRKLLEGAKPSADSEGMSIAKGASVCDVGNILLVLDPFAQPERIRREMRARTPIYKDYQPVPGVGDEAFFRANSTFANLHVWTGTRHFSIQMGGGISEDARTMKSNTIALADAIVPQLR